MKTRITELLGIEKPIIQGGMAWVANASLASAVSEAGGLGIIACGSASPEWLVGQLAEARAKTSKPIGVNIMMMSPHVPELAKIVAEQHVDVVTTGAGSPAPYIEMWKEAGVKVMPVVASTAHAKRMERAGADAVVAEGQEAGGHIGELTTMALTPAVCEAVSIPVVTAGGIADGRGMVAAFALGGEAVQIGTRFLTAEECTIHENFKQKVLDAKDSDTLVTGRLQGHPVRQLKNKFARSVKVLEEKAATDDSIDLEGIHTGSLRKAVVEGDLDEGSFMAGQVAALVCERKPAAAIIDQIMAEAEAWGSLGLQQMADKNAVRGWRG